MRIRTLALSIPSTLLCFVVACSSSSTAGAPDATIDVMNPDVLVEAPAKTTIPQVEAGTDSGPFTYDAQAAPSCASGLTYCAQAFGCIDLTSSTGYCGSCTMGCPASQTCSHSKCGCPSGTTLVGTTCTCPTGMTLSGTTCVANATLDAGHDAGSGDAHEDGHTGDAHEDGHAGDAHEDGHTGDAHEDGSGDAKSG